MDAVGGASEEGATSVPLLLDSGEGQRQGSSAVEVAAILDSE